jgi:hypothetical protein
MRLTLPLLTVAGAALAAVAHAQGRAPQQQPPLMECGTHGGLEVLCGTRSPEDLELTPDGKYLIVSQFVNGRGGAPASGSGAGLVLFDLAKKSYSKLAVSAEPRKDWGDPACPGPVGEALVPHGISLSKRSGGVMQLYVVNHGGRQSMEMFELKQAAGSWELVWHGCAVTMKEFNDVAVLPDGGFIATHPTALQVQGADLFSGQPSGYVARWTPGKGEAELPGTRGGYPNGVLVSSDGRSMYWNAWTAKEVHKYDLKDGKETGVVKLDFMPDNITWTSKHQMLAAGVKGARGDCPAGSGTPCVQAFGVAEIDPAKMEARTVFDSQGQGALISGVSVALQVGNSIYIGAFQGDRLVKIAYKK